MDEMEMALAIRMIQKNERGRQGRYRINQILKQNKKTKEAEEMKKRLQQGKLEDRAAAAATGPQAELASAEFIQRRIRGILARNHIEKMRQEEMVFLGMLRSKPISKGAEEIEDPVKKQDGTKEQRKQQ